MPLVKTLKTGGGTLFVWEMSESPDSLLALYPEACNDPAFSRISSPKRRQEWLSVRALLNAAGCSPSQLGYTESGKPGIDHPQYRWVSISHSDKLAGLFLHPSLRAGLDIENLNRNFVRVEQKYLSEPERLLASTIPDGHGLFWCIKEAVFKAAGIPGILFADQISITSGEGNKLEAKLTSENDYHFTIDHFRLNEQLIVTALAKKNKED